ncbi:interleukin-10 receptor subunit alpha isoform X2 [Peromyscus leucopus]|uniref:interleukin-10 receptor subunit alpha isoform X2 n=1 Tax=Peromyscus leucopus TaxID=10041 RepID=UPI0010A1171F|nr:interleukin-10 receptor subunit alpha isoform X2 [Peromyscus leucopus]
MRAGPQTAVLLARQIRRQSSTLPAAAGGAKAGSGGRCRCAPRMLSHLLLLLSALAKLSQGFRTHELPSPLSVWFEARFFQHILRWTPIPEQSESTYYEVELKRYGTKTWEDIPSCGKVGTLSCDLTEFTLDLYHSYGYWARVRAVDNSRYSNWTLTETRFTVDEVILTVGSVTLEVTNDGFIIGTIHPPRSQIVPAGDEYVQIFKNYRRYTISIRKFQEEKNTTMTVNYENFTFKVPTEKGEFCFKVKPSVETRNNRAEWSEEQCLRLTEQYFTVTNLSILFMSILILSGVLACLALQHYIRRPGKLPAVLVLEKSHNFFPVHPLCPETLNSVHILDLEAFRKVSPELKDSDLHGSTDSGFGGSGKPSLQTEESHFLLPGSHPQGLGMLGKEEPPELRGSCTDNTDSGICLQEPGSHSSMGPEWKQQLGYTSQGQDDSDVHLVQSSPEQAEDTQSGSALGHVHLLEPGVPEEKDQVVVTSQGYQKQARWKEEAADPAGHLDKEIPLADDSDPKLGVCLQAELAWPPPALAKGYLKQESQGMTPAPAGPLSRQRSQLAEGWSLLDVVSCGDLGTETWNFAHELAPQDYGAAPGGLLASFDSKLAALPLISSLQVEE